MSSPKKLEEIQAYLSEVQAEERCQRFEMLLSQAISAYDFDPIEKLLRAVELFSDGDFCLQQWTTYARAFLALEAYQKPADTIEYLKSLESQKQDLPPNLLGRVLTTFGITYDKTEQLDRALYYYQQCAELYEAEGNDLGLGKLALNRAIIYNKIHDYNVAIESLEQSIALLSRNPDSQLWQIPLASAWNELGLVKMALEQWDEAKTALEQYLMISKKWDYTFGEGIAYTNLGHFYRETGNFQQAMACYAQGRDLSLKASNDFEAAESIYGLGLVNLQDKTTLEQAKTLFEEALTVTQATNNHEISTKIFLGRAELQEKLKNAHSALKENRLAVDTVESLRANIVLPEDRARMQASRILAYEQMVARLYQSGLASDYAEALKYAEMAKSRALIEILMGRPIRRPENVPSEWLEQEAELRRSLHKLYHQSTSNRTQIAPLEAELAQLRQRIRLQDAEFESFHTVDPLSLDEIMARLPEDGVLVEYFTVGDKILAFVITSDKITVTDLPLGLKQLKGVFTQTVGGKLSHVRHLMPDGNGHLHQPWHLSNLSRVLLDPLGETVWTAPLLCIVPHGLLHYIPFHTLYQKTENGPRYLLGDSADPRQIVYAPSATTLFDYCQHKTPSSQTGCLAIGYNDPTVNLTQAELEAEAITRVVGGKCHTGSEAVRSVLFEEGRNYRYIHLACHGWFNPSWPMGSSLNLADASVDVADILQGLQLDADLVSLSACDTGRSHILGGDELTGLARAFLYAGTPSVMVSHWRVDDLSTRLFMEHFYQELVASSGQTEIGAKAKALGKAQNFIRNLTFEALREKLLAEESSTLDVNKQLNNLASSAGYDSLDTFHGDERLLAHPYYWSPFFLVGDWL